MIKNIFTICISAVVLGLVWLGFLTYCVMLDEPSYSAGLAWNQVIVNIGIDMGVI